MTAVEWLEQEFIKLESTIGVYGKMYELIEHAKQMEKTQIVESWNDGNLLGRNGNILLEYSDGLQYFNQNYNK